MRVDPEHPARHVVVQAGERPERNGVVPAENERQRAGSSSSAHELGDLDAGRLDRLEEPELLGAFRDRFRHRRADVSPVVARPADLLEPLVEARVPDRRGAHVDAAPVLAEIERRADHGDRLL